MWFAIRYYRCHYSCYHHVIINLSLLLADVATDTLAVERSKLESESEKGNLQSLAYTYRAVGMILGAVAGKSMMTFL